MAKKTKRTRGMKPVTVANALTGTNSGNLTCLTYSLLAEKKWKDPRTGQIITYYRIDVLADDGNVYYSDTDSIVVLQIQKIAQNNGNAGWNFNQNNGVIIS
jgi:hypothetical protein